MIKGKVLEIRLPVTEIFQSLEGEGTQAGFVTTFIRLFGCNLNCNWCDTAYSRAPHHPQSVLTVAEILAETVRLGTKRICLTGGEPLLHGEKSALLIRALSELDGIDDIHIETNGSIPLTPFIRLRDEEESIRAKVRFIMDYKLPGSGETPKMALENFSLLQARDEIKFVIADDQDFDAAYTILQTRPIRGCPLFSAVWGRMSWQRLAGLLVDHKLHTVRLNLQLQKVIWGDRRGV